MDKPRDISPFTAVLILIGYFYALVACLPEAHHRETPIGVKRCPAPGWCIVRIK